MDCERRATSMLAVAVAVASLFVVPAPAWSQDNGSHAFDITAPPIYLTYDVPPDEEVATVRDAVWPRIAQCHLTRTLDVGLRVRGATGRVLDVSLGSRLAARDAMCVRRALQHVVFGRFRRGEQTVDLRFEVNAPHLLDVRQRPDQPFPFRRAALGSLAPKGRGAKRDEQRREAAEDRPAALVSVSGGFVLRRPRVSTEPRR